MDLFVWNQHQAEQIRQESERTLQAQASDMRIAAQAFIQQATQLEAQATAQEHIAATAMKTITETIIHRDSDGGYYEEAISRLVPDEAARAAARAAATQLRNDAQQRRHSANLLNLGADVLESKIAATNNLFNEMFNQCQHMDRYRAERLLDIRNQIERYTRTMEILRDSFSLSISSMDGFAYMDKTDSGVGSAFNILPSGFILLADHMLGFEMPIHPSDAGSTSRLWTPGTGSTLYVPGLGLVGASNATLVGGMMGNGLVIPSYRPLGLEEMKLKGMLIANENKPKPLTVSDFLSALRYSTDASVAYGVGVGVTARAGGVASVDILAAARQTHSWNIGSGEYIQRNHLSAIAGAEIFNQAGAIAGIDTGWTYSSIHGFEMDRGRVVPTTYDWVGAYIGPFATQGIANRRAEEADFEISVGAGKYVVLGLEFEINFNISEFLRQLRGN